MAEDAMIRRANLQMLCERLSLTPTDLADRMLTAEERQAGKRPSVSYWSDMLIPERRKSFGEKVARKIEAQLQLPRGWLDEPHSPGDITGLTAVQAARPDAGVAQVVSEPMFEDAPHINWEALCAMDPDRIPQLFVMALPDEAMSPRLNKGVRVLIDRSLKPQGGDGVLVRDAIGGLYLRRYVERSAARWYAEAIAEGYARLESDADGLTVIGVVVAVYGRLSI